MEDEVNLVEIARVGSNCSEQLVSFEVTNVINDINRNITETYVPL